LEDCYWPTVAHLARLPIHLLAQGKGFAAWQTIASGLKPVRFEFEKKSAQLNLRLPKPLLDAVKRRAKERGIPYTRFLRELIEQGISTPLR